MNQQPWKEFWPPAPDGLFANPELNPICSSKGALPHDSKLADGTKVIRLDDIGSFKTEVAKLKVTEKTHKGSEPRDTK